MGLRSGDFCHTSPSGLLPYQATENYRGGRWRSTPQEQKICKEQICYFWVFYIMIVLNIGEVLEKPVDFKVSQI